MENVSFVGITVKYVTKLTDKLICLNTFISKFTSFNGLKYHKIRYKSRGNNPIRPFQFQFTCVSYVFLLVISFINKLWLLEMYLLKGAKSALSGEMKLFLPACSTPRNIGTRNIPEHPKSPEHP